MMLIKGKLRKIWREKHISKQKNWKKMKIHKSDEEDN
jgi:hypothetical protein